MTKEDAKDYIREWCPYDKQDEIIKALEQESVLDKIRAEIEQITSRYTISRERGAMGQVEWSDRLIKESEVLEILDKYKAESEDIGDYPDTVPNQFDNMTGSMNL